jgi:glucosamine-phosphate N-acetyltransferase
MSSTLTPTDTLTLAFPASLLPPSLHALLPSGLTLRPLASTDHSRGHLTLLSQLTSSPDSGPAPWLAQFTSLTSCPGTYYPVVILSSSTDTIVGTGMLVLERKFIHGMGSVGHIEDIAVDGSLRGQGVGKVIIRVLTELSESLGAYKVSLGEGR